eukprot:GCRY01002565.1.p1 GENE.GCRY01002565.1~~GCRY01002565.1.p1  ORF type:complete len:1027 (+),score=302.90 GCRY01002565.1:238-3318(+)
MSHSWRLLGGWLAFCLLLSVCFAKVSQSDLEALQKVADDIQRKRGTFDPEAIVSEMLDSEEWGRIDPSFHAVQRVASKYLETDYKLETINYGNKNAVYVRSFVDGKQIKGAPRVFKFKNEKLLAVNAGKPLTTTCEFGVDVDTAVHNAKEYFAMEGGKPELVKVVVARGWTSRDNGLEAHYRVRFLGMPGSRQGREVWVCGCTGAVLHTRPLVRDVAQSNYVPTSVAGSIGTFVASQQNRVVNNLQSTAPGAFFTGKHFSMVNNCDKVYLDCAAGCRPDTLRCAQDSDAAANVYDYRMVGVGSSDQLYVSELASLLSESQMEHVYSLGWRYNDVVYAAWKAGAWFPRAQAVSAGSPATTQFLATPDDTYSAADEEGTFMDGFVESQAYNSLEDFFGWIRDLLGDPNFCLTAHSMRCSDTDPQPLPIKVNYRPVISFGFDVETPEMIDDLYHQLVAGHGKTFSDPVMPNFESTGYFNAFFMPGDSDYTDYYSEVIKISSTNILMHSSDPARPSFVRGKLVDDVFFRHNQSMIVLAQYMDAQGASLDLGYDASVVCHEFFHAVVDTIASSALTSFSYDAYGANDDGAAINEALADYFSSAFRGDARVGIYSGESEHYPGLEPGAIPLRTSANTDTCEATFILEEHADSTHITGALWAIRTFIGSKLGAVGTRAYDSLVLEALIDAEAEGVWWSRAQMATDITQLLHDAETVATSVFVSPTRSYSLYAKKIFQERGLQGPCGRLFALESASGTVTRNLLYYLPSSLSFETTFFTPSMIVPHPYIFAVSLPPKITSFKMAFYREANIADTLTLFVSDSIALRWTVGPENSPVIADENGNHDILSVPSNDIAENDKGMAVITFCIQVRSSSLERKVYVAPFEASQSPQLTYYGIHSDVSEGACDAGHSGSSDDDGESSTVASGLALAFAIAAAVVAVIFVRNRRARKLREHSRAQSAAQTRQQPLSPLQPTQVQIVTTQAPPAAPLVYGVQPSNPYASTAAAPEAPPPLYSELPVHPAPTYPGYPDDHGAM